MSQQNDPMIGRQISRYRVVRKIAQGGMGAVYQAEETESGQRVAIKVLLPELSSRPDAVQRFFTEAKATGLVEHASLVRILEHGKTPDGDAYIAMEFLDGKSLRQSQDEKYYGGSAIGLVRQMASALAATHARRIVHRDLKPENVMLIEDSAAPGGVRAKILDFGIAKLLPDGSAPTEGNAATRTGTLIGTPMYMSPEQCRASAPPDEKTDVYSLGIMLYELLYGEPPFVSDSAGELFALQMFGNPPRLKERVPQITDSLDELVHRLLDKQPSSRPSMAELGEALAKIPSTGLKDGPLSARPSAQRTGQEPEGATSGIIRSQLTTGTRQTGRTDPHKHAAPPSRTLPFVLVAVVMVVGVLLIVLLSQRKKTTSGVMQKDPTGSTAAFVPSVDAGATSAVAAPPAGNPNVTATPSSAEATDTRKSGGKGTRGTKGSRKSGSHAGGTKVEVDLWK